MMKKNALDLLEFQKKSVDINDLPQCCQKKLQDSNLEKEVLKQQLEEVRSASLDLENQLRETQDNSKRVRTLNEEWQEMAMMKCDLIHAMFTEIRSSFKEQGGDEPNAPVSKVTNNHIHLGRGV
ncbi:uncharacterized protein LOC117179464 [Belonocnema kinseyi]|uniref:uncharacterized protein LOC117179464 n=1 Tax=Belonocnema kinseyi TaxID=2817044 RepID=UPI00143D8065|nr:uncharacterized protein LOC117179464 [Belonocnema kinseyi]